MHMADALLSPAVGGTMWAATAGMIAYSSRKVRQELDDRKVPLMGVLGAFLFAAQMINFSIPATGSSGHLGGGLLLTILLGPWAAFLTIASVLVVQALFFADGGLLALGCNVFNMGFIPAFIVYPLVYRRIAGKSPSQARLTTAIMISAIVGLQLGPFGVVLETWFSGISALPFSTFALLMQPIHLAIGIVEGVVTVAVVSFVFKARPEILHGALEAHPSGVRPLRAVAAAFLAAAILTGGIVSWFASKDPDGLEWAIARVTGTEALKGPEQGLHRALAGVQGKTAFLPDYSFRKPAEPQNGGVKPEGEARNGDADRLGTSVAGVVGVLMTLALALLAGFVLKKRKQSAC
ncbi:energy-coupling factor ABC transporter permease [Geobacter pickeringii]|uniref:Cobalamin biosynthesis protein CbiM n=1 Tax=Geobacter pickeringii TaxID=345632 RepID=A0A0B5B8E4_9BACT|nr:energy-coupling factor ABC transporter permease [Geobacter pickeringii]AJE02928.1 cobalamin biosynthesis protein CbiM [Geobacter pickeringii]